MIAQGKPSKRSDCAEHNLNQT